MGFSTRRSSGEREKFEGKNIPFSPFVCLGSHLSHVSNRYKGSVSKRLRSSVVETARQKNLSCDAIDEMP